MTRNSDDLVFKALAGADRRRILDLLSERPRATSEIGAELPHLDRTTVMQHLRVLEEAGLVFSRKKGRVRWNYLDVSPIQRIHERWITRFAAPSAALAHRLRKDLEDFD
jgi:DNA-binding transcriptional ArsR family regulator